MVSNPWHVFDYAQFIANRPDLILGTTWIGFSQGSVQFARVRGRTYARSDVGLGG